MIYDCFLFRDETDMLLLRLQWLWEKVDMFVLVEGNMTQKGVQKPYNFENNKHMFQQYLSKIKYVKCDMTEQSKGVDFNYKQTHLNQKHESWKLENYQRNYIMNGLVDATENDLILISDLDEIPEHIPMTVPTGCIMDFYYYDICTRNPNELWVGTVALLYKQLQQLTPQIVRDNRFKFKLIQNGWHFSYFGGIDMVHKKVKSIIEGESVLHACGTSINDVEKNITNRMDLYGRGGEMITINPVNVYPANLLKLLQQFPSFLKYS